MTLKGKKVLITGANRGFGLAVAEAFLREGADVMLAARDLDLLEREALRLRAGALPGQSVVCQHLDLADPLSVNGLAAQLKKTWDRLDVLVNNAGIYGPKGKFEEQDMEAWESAIHVNLMGPVRLCQLVLPLLKKASAGRIINLSGGGATAPLPRLSAYAASKAALVRFSETLAEELREDGIAVNAVAPGALNTRLLDEVLEAGPGKLGQAFYDKAVEQKSKGGSSLAEGAALCVFLASDASAGITGKLISAVWDPWRHFGELKEKMQGNDLYTLRRIVPKDRGLDF